jgi:hypothetical protein
MCGKEFSVTCFTVEGILSSYLSVKGGNGRTDSCTLHAGIIELLSIIFISVIV